MPKVLLIRVPGGRKDPRKHPVPNLGMGYLAGIAEREGYGACIIDGYVWIDMGCFPEDAKLVDRIAYFIKEAEKENPDILGVSVINSDLAISIEFAKAYKEKHPGTMIVFGGLGVNGIADIIGRYTGDSVSVIVKGEGEETFQEILREFRKGKQADYSNIKGLSYFSKRKWHHNENRPLIRNLDSLPVVNFNYYKNLPSNTVYLLEVERGCPGSCRFCFVTKTWGIGRYFSIEHIDRQIKTILDYQRNPNRISISDSNLMAYPEKGIEILEFLAHRYPRFIGNVNLRVDQITPHILDLFQRFRSIAPLVGIESLSPELLIFLGKTKDPKNYIKQVHWMISEFQKRRILYTLSLIYHIPGETKKDLDELYQFLFEQPEDLCILIYLSHLWLEGNTYFWELYTQNKLPTYPLGTNSLSLKLGKQYDDIIFRVFNYWVANPQLPDEYYMNFLDKVRKDFKDRKTLLRS